MSDVSAAASIVDATQYLRQVCEEVVALSKVIHQRFAVLKPKTAVIRSVESWPRQFPGSEFFEAYIYRLNFGEKQARTANIGAVTYLFDLGRANRIASDKKMPLVIATWSDASEGAYTIDSLETIAKDHKPLGSRLLRWIDQETEKPIDDAWLYVVPLISVNTEKDVDRLLINPLLAVANANQLNKTVVEKAFVDAPEVLMHGSDT
jgi:hypothetical protein